MAGRRVVPQSNTVKLREPPLSSRQPQSRHLPSLHHLEDRVAIQHGEIQSLLLDNQRLAATHVALKQELSLARQELRHLSSTAAEIKAQRDAEVREVYEKSLKLDAEVRVIDAMNAELDQVRADVEQLGMDRLELTKQLKEINAELAKVKEESKDVTAIKAEIETVRQEIQRGRAAIEHEKKNQASNLEQGQAMEKHIASMAQQSGRLQAELANAEKRARAAAAVAAAAVNPSPGYAASYGNPDTGFGGSPYPGPYNIHQAQGGTDPGHLYMPGPPSHGSQEIHGSHVHR